MPTKVIPNLVVQSLGENQASKSLVPSQKVQSKVTKTKKSKVRSNIERINKEKTKVDSICPSSPPFNIEEKNNPDLTPKKKSQMHNKVTPGSDNSSKKRMLEIGEINESSKPPPQKKQRSLLSFFSKSSTKPQDGSHPLKTISDNNSTSFH
jgi:hypothetical protein